MITAIVKINPALSIQSDTGVDYLTVEKNVVCWVQFKSSLLSACQVKSLIAKNYFSKYICKKSLIICDLCMFKPWF